jgi:hypothetical protein
LFKKLFKTKETLCENTYDQIIDGLTRRYSKEEYDLQYDDLRGYEKHINQQIRNNMKYKKLHVNLF